MFFIITFYELYYTHYTDETIWKSDEKIEERFTSSHFNSTVAEIKAQQTEDKCYGLKTASIFEFYVLEINRTINSRLNCIKMISETHRKITLTELILN